METAPPNRSYRAAILVLVGIVGAAYFFVVSEGAATFPIFLLSIVATAGASHVAGRWRAYAVSLAAAGLFAFLYGLGYYLTYGLTVLTLLLALLGVVCLGKGVSVYRAI
jgi:hypothetical protein